MAVDPYIARGITPLGLGIPDLALQIRGQQQRYDLGQQQLGLDQQGLGLQQQRITQDQTAFDAQRQQAADAQDAEMTWARVQAGDPSALDYALQKAAAAHPQMAELAQRDPQAAKKAVYQALANQFSKPPSDTKIGQYNPGDYTPASWAEFLQGGYRDPSGLRRQYAPPGPPNMTVVQLPEGQGAFNPRTGSVTPISSRAAQREASVADVTATTAAKAQTEAGVAAQTAEPKAQAKDTLALALSSNVITQIDKAVKGVNWSTVGPVGAMARAVPGTPAYDLGQTLTTIKANLGFDRLQAMRENSPTGGALGQVAVQELQALQASIASLDQAQSGTQLRDSLAQVREHYTKLQDTIRKGADQRQQRLGNPSPAASPAAPAAGPARIQSDADYNALPSGAEFIGPDGKRRRKP